MVLLACGRVTSVFWAVLLLQHLRLPARGSAARSLCASLLQVYHCAKVDLFTLEELMDVLEFLPCLLAP